MSGLTDLIATARAIKVAGREINITPLTVDAIAKLLARFEKLREQIAGAGSDGGSILAAIAKAGPEAMAAVIAAGTNESEEIARKVPFGRQIDVIDAIIKESMPAGDGPLAKMLKGAGTDLFSMPTTQAPTSSPTSGVPAAPLKPSS